MDRPKIDNAPGLAWRPRADGWVATWVARADIVRKGFSPSTQRLLLLTVLPTDEQTNYIQSECSRLQDEMLGFGRGGATEPDQFNGLIQGIVDAYQTDPDSPYRAIRHKTRKNYDVHCKLIREQKGARAISAIKARDFKRWYEEWRWPQGKDGPDQAYMAHGSISMLRNLLGYGIAFELEDAPEGQISHCQRLKTILSEMQFEKGGARREQITHAQADLIIKEATRRGEISIALTQALQYELTVHQKDCIGEWVPVSEPGLSDITWSNEKWLYGIRWEEITPDLILSHKMAKSRKGKLLEFDLKLYPMVMSVLALIPEDRRTGPLVKCEKTGMPWAASTFAQHWRSIARAVGIPNKVWNMDSRAGGTTETLDATDGNLEAARKQAGHTDIKTTQRYSRGDLKSNSKVAVLRVASRPKGNGE